MVSPSNDMGYRMNSHHYNHINGNYENKIDLMINTQGERDFNKNNSVDNNNQLFS